jgi:2-desacetyl-2-hydroxyethyl bacteriochlorophyllide A dehydrogenase
MNYETLKGGCPVKAIQKQGTGIVAYIDAPIPDYDLYDLLLKPLFSGICATDLHVLYHDLGQKKGYEFPLIMGHEFSATVYEIGSQAEFYVGTSQKIQVGDRVTVEPVLPCGKCNLCLQGRINLCPHMSHLGIYEDGCYGDYVRVPAHRVHRLPNEISDRAGSLVEPLACAINFVDKSRMKTGDSIVILGGGSIGQLTLQLVLAAGAGKVIVSEPVSSKRELALRVGAHAVIDPVNEDVVQRVRELTDNNGADIVIECVGVEATVSQMVHLVRRGGRCVMAGFPSKTINMDLESLVFGEVELLGVMATAWQFPRAIRMIQMGLVNVEQTLDRVVPFSKAIEALKEAHESKEVGKLVIEHAK